MTEAYICAALRTPVGKHGGSLAGVRADDLAAIPIKAVVERSGVDPRSIDDVILGCTNQAGEDRSEEHTSELQSRPHLVCRLLLEKKKSNSGNMDEMRRQI